MLGENGLTDLAVGRLIVEAMRIESCNISTLDLNNNQIGAHVVTQAIKFNKTLTSLDITGSPIDDDGLGMIGDLLLQPYCPCAVRFISCFAFDAKDGALDITLHSETLGEGGTKLLAGIFKYNNLVKKLNLSNRGIEPSAASVLAVSVEHNTTLTSMDLSGNPIADVAQYTRPKEPFDTKAGCTRSRRPSSRASSCSASRSTAAGCPSTSSRARTATRRCASSTSRARTWASSRPSSSAPCSRTTPSCPR